MAFTQSEVLDFVRENDVKFIRLAFCNLFGAQKNIAIMVDRLAEAFRDGICIDAASVEGLVCLEDADIFLVPDPSTLSILPWRPSHGRVVRLFCEMRCADGSPYPADGRRLLRQAVEKAALEGLSCDIGSECELYLFQLDEEGRPTMTPQDSAGYCDIAPLDKGENVRREICLALEEMGTRAESSHHERGPGQNEIVLRYTGALEAADALVSMQSVCGVVAARNGLFASFDPKPLPGQPGSSIHLNLSLSRDGKNLFQTGGGAHCAEAESFMAGILHHLPELSLFLNPMAGSYDRFGEDVPTRLQWSHQNREVLVRIPAASTGHARMELRSPDASLSPYFSFALLLEAGLRGIREKLPLTHGEDREVHLPESLGEAVRRARESDLVREIIPQAALEAYCGVKLKESPYRQRR